MSAAAILSTPARQQPIPTIIDTSASETPDKVLFVIPRTNESKDGALYITWASMARAVDRAAHFLERTLGKAKDFPKVTFMSNNYDIRYVIFLIAGIKTGHCMFMASPRNSEEYQVHLIEKIGVKNIISSIGVGKYAEKTGCKVFEPPTLDDLLADGPFEHYHYSKTLAQASEDHITMMHSSGSTGPPKPIGWVGGYLESTRKAMLASSGSNFRSLTEAAFLDNDLFLVAMPLFHSAGLLLAFCVGIFCDHPILFPPPASLMNGANVLHLVKTFGITAGTIAPSVLEEIAYDDELLPQLAAMKTVAFGGGALAKAAGEKLRSVTRPVSAIGSTEASFYPLAEVPEGVESDAWFHYPPVPGFTMRPEADGTAELVFERSNFDWAVFHTFPDATEYATSDLYEKHPTIPDLWHHVGRKDDVIVLSNGEKVVPPPMEDLIRRAPEVEGALYFGQTKTTVGCLIELNEEACKGLTLDEIRQRIRPYALKANELAPAFARLTKDMVLYTSKDKPMRRTPKGSFIRRGTIAAYADEIEALYENQAAEAAVPMVKGLSEAETQKALLDMFEYMVGKSIKPTEDLFQSVGADSMQAIAVTRSIKASVQKEAPEYAKKVTASLIYSHPTIEQLAKAVRSLVQTGSSKLEDPSIAIKDMLEKYSEGMAASVPRASSSSDKTNVVLTGSTGSLGSYMLDILINDPEVGNIYALNRSNDGAKKQEAGNSSRGLSTDFSKVSFFKFTTGNKYLGLAPAEYQELVNNANLIIHNAWSVDFNQSLESFEPHIRGVRSFIDLASESKLRPHINFISSIGTVTGWDDFYPGTPRPEELIEDSRPAYGGYAAGKWVSEHLLGRATAFGIDSTTSRVGQVAGPVGSLKGQWNVQEWLPTIINSSNHMGKLPDSLGGFPVDFIPVDYMAKMVVELGFSDMEAQKKKNSNTGKQDIGLHTTYNLTNPHVSDWITDLVPAVRKHLPNVDQLVSFHDWVEQVRKDSEAADADAAKHPAIKLLEFYEGLDAGQQAAAKKNVVSVGFSTAAAQAHSKTAASVPANNGEWMETWMKQWGF